MRLYTLHIIYLICIFTFTCKDAFPSCLTDRNKCVVYVSDSTDFQKQLSKRKTLYIINCNIDLRGQRVVVPESSVLQFNAKRISNGTLVLKSHTRIIGNGVEFISQPHKQMIVSDGVVDINIDGVTFNSTGNRHSSYEYAGVFIKNSKDIKIHDCIFLGDSCGLSGFMGLAMFKVNRMEIYQNTFDYFYKPDFWNSHQKNTAWATYLVSVKNANIHHNKLYKTYSGIKLTGFIENVRIYSNESYDSITDGCDFAGISAKNVTIENNKFENCGDCGIEFKILFLKDWHKNDMLGYYGYDFNTPRFFKDIIIRNNKISSWVGLKIWNQYNKSKELLSCGREMGYDKRSGNIILCNNILSKADIGSGNPNSSVGIQVAYNSIKQGDFQINSNTILGHKFGVYFVNSSKINVHGNILKSLSCSIYERFEQADILKQESNYDICIDGNTIDNIYDYAILLSERTKKWLVTNNEIKVAKGENMFSNHGQNNKISNNHFVSK